MKKSTSKDERKKLVERDNTQLSVVKQAKLLEINRSSLYYKPVALSIEEMIMKRQIDEIYTQHPDYGSRCIAASLKRKGVQVNRKAVQRHMREMGISGVCPAQISAGVITNTVYIRIYYGKYIQAPWLQSHK